MVDRRGEMMCWVAWERRLELITSGREGEGGEGVKRCFELVVFVVFVVSLWCSR